MRERPSIHVRCFAFLRDLVGEEVILELTSVQEEEGLSLEELWALLLAKHPALAEHTGYVRVAVRGEYASPEVHIHVGDEVALIPPVSGG